MISTKYGPLHNEFACKYYEDGKIKSCKFEDENVINTSFGKLIPKYQIAETRARDRDAVEFYSNGLLKSIYLERATNIITSKGIINCEFITFYESGKIHRVFPTYGKVGATWSEEEEIKLSPRIKINLEGIQIHNKLSCICFYENGMIRSLTFYSGEKNNVKVKDGEVEIRIGISFYENGMIRSIEPATPTLINTPIGMLIAYDNNPVGIHGDNNSLEYDEYGEVRKVTTIQTGIEIIDNENKTIHIQALRKHSLLELEKFVMYPIKVEFKVDGLNITNSNNETKFYDYANYKISTFYNMLYRPDACTSDCQGCKGCH